MVLINIELFIYRNNLRVGSMVLYSVWQNEWSNQDNTQFQESSAPGSEGRRHYYGEQVVWERDRMVHFLCTKSYLNRWKWWGAGWGGWLDCHPEQWWCLGMGCGQGPCGAHGHEAFTVCVDVHGSDSTKIWEDRAVQCWPQKMRAFFTTLGETGPLPHQLKYSGERVIHFTWAKEQKGPCSQGNV